MRRTLTLTLNPTLTLTLTLTPTLTLTLTLTRTLPNPDTNPNPDADFNPSSSRPPTRILARYTLFLARFLDGLLARDGAEKLTVLIDCRPRAG